MQKTPEGVALYLCQPVRNSVLGEKVCREQKGGSLPRLAVRKLIKLLVHCEEGER